jgi:prepilin-type N-terminal cleavage/methylation domain-containing protein
MSRRGFTLVELLIVIAIIGLLFAMLLSTMSTIEFLKKNTGCAKNLKDIHAVLQSYTTASDERYPYPFDHYYGRSFSGTYNSKDRWLGLPQVAKMIEYGAEKEMFFCPFDATYDDWDAWPNSTWVTPHYDSKNGTVVVYIGYTFFTYRMYPWNTVRFSNGYNPIIDNWGLDDTPIAADTLFTRNNGSIKWGWTHGGGLPDGLYNSSCNTLFKNGAVVYTEAEGFDWSKPSIIVGSSVDYWWCALEPGK